MQLNTQEHIDLIAQFEKQYKGKIGRLDREKSRDWWKRGHIYEHGEVNHAFICFRDGYSLAKSIYQSSEEAQP